MPYAIVLKPAARRDLKSIPKPDLKHIAAKIDALADDPRPPGAKVLEAKDKLMRIRSGDYRIIYQVRDKRLVVLVIRVGHRREIYRKMKRKGK